MLKIHTILCRAGSMENYSYLIIDMETNISAIIDPSEVAPIVKKCQELNIRPNYILNTHHHFDHTDGNEELKELYGAEVVANFSDRTRIPGHDISVRVGRTFKVGRSTAQIIDAPGHTKGHILWYFADDKALFTGDVLFNLCIGGLFEGDAQQMFNTLHKIKDLPDDTMFYPGHEYTVHGAQFAYEQNSGNQEIQDYLTTAENRIKQNLPVHPVSLGIEKKCNPYLQVDTIAKLKRLC